MGLGKIGKLASYLRRADKPPSQLTTFHCIETYSTRSLRALYLSPPPVVHRSYRIPSRNHSQRIAVLAPHLRDVRASRFHSFPRIPARMATHGQADSYYNGGGGQPNHGYPMQSQMQYPPQAAGNGYQNGEESKYQQQPPNYDQNFQNPRPPPVADNGGKQTFAQAFKLDKPKYNDLWAGILVCPPDAVLSLSCD